MLIRTGATLFARTTRPKPMAVYCRVLRPVVNFSGLPAAVTIWYPATRTMIAVTGMAKVKMTSMILFRTHSVAGVVLQDPRGFGKSTVGPVIGLLACASATGTRRTAYQSHWIAWVIDLIVS